MASTRKNYMEWLWDQGQADAQAGKAIGAFYDLKLPKGCSHNEAARSRYERGYRDEKQTQRENGRGNTMELREYETVCHSLQKKGVVRAWHVYHNDDKVGNITERKGEFRLEELWRAGGPKIQLRSRRFATLLTKAADMVPHFATRIEWRNR